MSRSERMHPGVWALAVTAFAIGVAEFIVVGVLPAIADDLGVSVATAGSLVGLYALALAVGTPILIIAAGRIPRKALLFALVSVFLAGNLISAFATSYEILLAGRILTAVAHGSFFAIGATVAARLSPLGQASRAIAAMFAGLTLAMVIGVPMGSLIGNELGWRLPFFGVVALAAVGLLAIALWVPKQPHEADVSAAQQLKALKTLPVLVMMSITILGFGASFAAFTFITPILTEETGFSSGTASLLLIVFGVATLVGNLMGGRWAAHYGWARTLRIMLAGVAVLMVAMALGMSNQYVMVPLLFAWGVLAFGMSPGFQTGMLETAERWSPKAVAFTSALNISAFNLGITLGEHSGSALVEQGLIGLTPWAGLALAALAQLPLFWLAARHRRSATANNPAMASA